MVREYKGSHSGEHGDGIVRSEFHRQMFGDRVVDAFGEVKRAFDPRGLMNPGRIVDVIEVGFDRPRAPGLFSDPAFHRVCDHIAEVLHGG